MKALSLNQIQLPVTVSPCFCRYKLFTKSNKTSVLFVANAAPTPRVISGINNLITIVPAAVGAIAVIVFYFGYRIDEAQVLQMQHELATKKVQEAAPV